MQTFIIKSHRSGLSYDTPHFFILNKGNNSGKPLINPCPNCFVILFDDVVCKEQYYWLIMGLWQAKAFYPYLRGSVIPFVILSDVKQCLQNGFEIANKSLSAFEKSVKALHQLDILEAQYKQNLKLIQEAKRMLFYQYMK